MSRTPRLASRSPAPWLATWMLLACPLLASAAPDATLAEAQQEAAQALSLASSPRGAAHLLRLHALEPDVEDLTPISKVYADVATRGRADAHTRATAQFLMMDLERSRGRMQRAAEWQDSLGFVRDFQVVGGFDNEGKAGCDTDFGPEAAALDLSTRYTGAKGPVSWRPLGVAPNDGYIDLGAALRPNREAVAYAVTWLDVPAETRVALGVGTSGAFRMWVNGEKAASSDHYNLPRPDQTRVSVRLRKGLNRVLVKVCQEAGPLGFYLRREQPGRVRATLPAAAPALARGASPAPQVLPTLTSSLKDAVARAPTDAVLRGEYATVLDYFRAFDEREHTASVEAERAARAAPTDARLQLLAATTSREDLNQRRAFLEAATRADPTFLRARVALAEFELERGHPERTAALLGSALEESPDSAGARLALGRAYEALGETARAHKLVEDTLQRLPRLPRVVRAAASSARALDRPEEAIGRLRVALALRHDDRGSRTLLATLLADRGQMDAAAREYAQLLALYPFDNATRIKLAELQAANGQLDAATAGFAEARALCPDEPELYEREGRALLAASHREEALRAFERSLALRPQNPTLKEALRTLKGEAASAGTQYLDDPRALASQVAQYEVTEDAVYLTDTTFVRVQKSGLSGRLHHFAVKVLNARGVDAFRTYPVTYSPDRQEVRILRARITKPDGSVVDSYGESDRNINEPWTGMYYDARAKMLSFPALAAGDTLELQYRVDDTAQDNLLSDYWGDVESVQGVYPKVSYQFMVEMPKERPLYWNEKKLPGVTYAHEEVEGERVLHRWSAKQVAKVVPEPGMPGWAEVAANLHVSTYRTWDEVGRYWWGLVRDQLTPNEELRQTVETVLKGVDRKDHQAVMRAIYNFVVTNTRYVALEFGIHGFKPYRVDRVLSRRFGDCKDKASLIHAMLKVAGVDSRLVLLRMRDLGAIGEEPASLAAFNHAIVYVPQFGLYLDGTAEFHGAKELPSSDRLANVLVVEPGGKATFLTTPEAKPEDNSTRVAMDVTLRPDGSAEVGGTTQVGGQMAPEYRRAYRAVSSRKSTFERAWAQSFPGLTVRDVSLNDTTRLDDDVKVDFRMAIPRFAEALPGQLRFLPLGTGRAYTQTYASLATRHFDLVMSGPWVNRFTFKYALPQGYSVAELPPAVQEESPFGRARLACQQTGQTMLCEGEVALTAARVKADDYAAFRAFLGRVDQGFSRKITLRGPPAPTAQR